MSKKSSTSLPLGLILTGASIAALSIIPVFFDDVQKYLLWHMELAAVPVVAFWIGVAVLLVGVLLFFLNRKP